MFTTITRDALKARLDAAEPVVLVEALPEKYYRHTHLPGAINIPHDGIDTLAPAMLPDKDAPIVVYCANLPCRNSEIAARRLAELGYRHVAEYREGKAHWIEAGLPVEGDSAVGGVTEEWLEGPAVKAVGITAHACARMPSPWAGIGPRR